MKFQAFDLRAIKERLPLIVILLALIAVFAAAGWRYYDYKKTASWLPARIEPIGEEVAKLITKIGNHVVLPDNEEPTVATVTSADLLKNQMFFANARVGDTVLIYPKAKRVFLYSPVLDRVLNIAPLANDNQASEVTKSR